MLTNVCVYILFSYSIFVSWRWTRIPTHREGDPITNHCRKRNKLNHISKSRKKSGLKKFNLLARWWKGLPEDFLRIKGWVSTSVHIMSMSVFLPHRAMEESHYHSPVYRTFPWLLCTNLTTSPVLTWQAIPHTIMFHLSSSLVFLVCKIFMLRLVFLSAFYLSWLFWGTV